MVAPSIVNFWTTYLCEPDAHHPALHGGKIFGTKTTHSFGFQIMKLRMLKKEANTFLETVLGFAALPGRRPSQAQKGFYHNNSCLNR